MKKTFIAILAMMMVLAMTCSASACTALYVGGNMTYSGNPIWGRIEDMSNSMNKLFSVIPAGVHKAGDSYEGCYGFTYTFTHDSYGYTACMDDTLLGECPDCGSDHEHTPYQAAGTNDQGLSMSATETLYNRKEIKAVDPYNGETGIEEAEIVTVILSECANVQEALALLTNIYETKGCQDGAGIFLADQSEVWYIENCSGTQYIAVKLNNDVIFCEPNVSIIGLMDLDDTENVIASSKLIDVAVEAGTFVGDAEKNIINFAISYAGSSCSQRMVNGLNYVTCTENYNSETPAEDFCVSNLDADGNIVTLYSPVVAGKVFEIADIIGYYQVDAIGKPANLETHFFEIAPEGAPETAIVEWLSMNDNQYSLFVPYFPMLTTEAYEAYFVGTAKAAFAQELAEGQWGYPSTGNVMVDGKRTKVDGFKVLPEGWEKSMYWCADALSNYLVYTDGTQADYVKAQLADVQAQFIADFAAFAASDDVTAESATALSMSMAKTAHETIYNLFVDISK